MQMASQFSGQTPEQIEAQLQQLEAQARLILTARGGHDWLLNGPQFYSVQNITDSVNAAGLRSASNGPLDEQAVLRWVNKIAAMRPEYVQDFGGSFGKRVSQRGLLYWFAGILDKTPPLS